MAQQQEAIAVFAFVGGLSAGTGMVIVETIALSTMVCNDLVMPVLLRLRRLRLNERRDLGMRRSPSCVPAFAYDVGPVHEHRPDKRMRVLDLPSPPLGKLERPLEAHASACTSRR